MIFLTDAAMLAMQDYLAVRGPGPTDHVFLYRNQPMCKDLVSSRLKTAGKRVGVKVHPHRLRHTAATQLVNAGCPIVSIQKFLGHKQLNTTMIYARVHDRTVAEDYYAALEQIEQKLGLVDMPKDAEDKSINAAERSQLIDLANALAKGNHSPDAVLEISSKMQQILTGENSAKEQENMADIAVLVPV